MPNVGPMELLLLALLALLLFGPKKLPEMGRSLGKGMRELKDSFSEHSAELKDAIGVTDLDAVTEPRSADQRDLDSV